MSTIAGIRCKEPHMRRPRGCSSRGPSSAADQNCQRQNSANRMMIGSGMPSNQSSAPRPKPMVVSSACGTSLKRPGGVEVPVGSCALAADSVAAQAREKGAALQLGALCRARRHQLQLGSNGVMRDCGARRRPSFHLAQSSGAPSRQRLAWKQAAHALFLSCASSPAHAGRPCPVRERGLGDDGGVAQMVRAAES
jgi:hypothetical protein